MAGSACVLLIVKALAFDQGPRRYLLRRKSLATVVPVTHIKALEGGGVTCPITPPQLDSEVPDSTHQKSRFNFTDRRYWNGRQNSD